MTIHMYIYDSIHYWNSLKFERKSICEWVQIYTGRCRDTYENCWKSCYTQNYRQDKKNIRIFYQCLDHNILYYVLSLSSTWQHIKFKPQVSQSTLHHIDSGQKKKTNLPKKKIQHIRIRKHSTIKKFLIISDTFSTKRHFHLAYILQFQAIEHSDITRLISTSLY